MWPGEQELRSDSVDTFLVSGEPVSLRVGEMTLHLGMAKTSKSPHGDTLFPCI